MIINNTHVRGIFFYSSDIAYEKGDFVVQDDIIYICTANNPTDIENFTVQNSNPSTDGENYTVYLGNKITTAEEYFDYVKNPNGENVEDKYVSSHVLFNILSSYMSGFNEKGIISNYINYDRSNISYSDNLASYLENVERQNLLDAIIRAEDLNNAIFHISRSLVDDSLLQTVPDDTPGFNSTDLNSVILKQYTYQDSGNENITYRVQELIDHVCGMVLYRYINMNTDSISSWKDSWVDQDFRDKVNAVQNYYRTKSNELEEEKQNLLNNFAFRNVRIIKNQSVSIQCSDPDQNGYIDVESFSSDISCILTIIIQEQYDDRGIYKNTSLTIDISDSMSTDNITDYYVTNNNTLTVGKENPNSTSANSLTLSVTTGRISNIYYRQFYKGE